MIVAITLTALALVAWTGIVLYGISHPWSGHRETSDSST